jgi:hypothetical protein
MGASANISAERNERAQEKEVPHHAERETGIKRCGEELFNREVSSITIADNAPYNMITLVKSTRRSFDRL